MRAALDGDLVLVPRVVEEGERTLARGHERGRIGRRRVARESEGLRRRELGTDLGLSGRPGLGRDVRAPVEGGVREGAAPDDRAPARDEQLAQRERPPVVLGERHARDHEHRPVRVLGRLGGDADRIGPQLVRVVGRDPACELERAAARRVPVDDEIVSVREQQVQLATLVQLAHPAAHLLRRDLGDRAISLLGHAREQPAEGVLAVGPAQRLEARVVEQREALGPAFGEVAVVGEDPLAPAVAAHEGLGVLLLARTLMAAQMEDERGRDEAVPRGDRLVRPAGGGRILHDRSAPLARRVPAHAPAEDRLGERHALRRVESFHGFEGDRRRRVRVEAQGDELTHPAAPAGGAWKRRRSSVIGKSRFGGDSIGALRPGV